MLLKLRAGERLVVRFIGNDEKKITLHYSEDGHIDLDHNFEEFPNINLAHYSEIERAWFNRNKKLAPNLVATLFELSVDGVVEGASIAHISAHAGISQEDNNSEFYYQLKLLEQAGSLYKQMGGGSKANKYFFLTPEGARICDQQLDRPAQKESEGKAAKPEVEQRLKLRATHSDWFKKASPFLLPVPNMLALAATLDKLRAKRGDIWQVDSAGWEDLVKLSKLSTNKLQEARRGLESSGWLHVDAAPLGSGRRNVYYFREPGQSSMVLQEVKAK